MKAILCLVAILASVATFVSTESPLLAQGQPDKPSCPQCVRVATTTCTENYDCSYGTFADYVEFTPNCSGTYVLSVQLVCPNESDCSHCLGCARLYLGTTPIGNSFTTCEDNGCKECSGMPNGNCPSYYLNYGSVYRLYVGKLPCAPGQCSDCNSQCRAVAYARTAGSTCQNP